MRASQLDYLNTAAPGNVLVLINDVNFQEIFSQSQEFVFSGTRWSLHGYFSSGDMDSRKKITVGIAQSWLLRTDE